MGSRRTTLGPVFGLCAAFLGISLNLGFAPSAAAQALTPAQIQQSLYNQVYMQNGQYQGTWVESCRTAMSQYKHRVQPMQVMTAPGKDVVGLIEIDSSTDLTKVPLSFHYLEAICPRLAGHLYRPYGNLMWSEINGLNTSTRINCRSIEWKDFFDFQTGESLQRRIGDPWDCDGQGFKGINYYRTNNPWRSYLWPTYTESYPIRTGQATYRVLNPETDATNGWVSYAKTAANIVQGTYWTGRGTINVSGYTPAQLRAGVTVTACTYVNSKTYGRVVSLRGSVMDVYYFDDTGDDSPVCIHGVRIIMRDSDFLLRPTTVCSPASVAPGQEVTCTHTVAKSGAAPETPDVKTQVACSYRNSLGGVVGSAPSDCVGSAIPDTKYSQTSTQYTRKFTVPVNAQAGYRICSQISVTPSSNTSPGTATGSESCVVVQSEKYAHTLFFGGDIVTSGAVQFVDSDGTSLPPNPSVGSKVQLAILANGDAEKSASANRLDSPGKYDLLYGNNGAPGLQRGYFGRSQTTYTVPAWPTNPAPQAVGVLNNFDSQTGTQYFAPLSGTTTVGVAGVSGASGHYHLIVFGDFEIGGNITIDRAAPRTIASIPNIIIEATGNIIIAPGVTQIDATLIAGGTLFTCGNTKPTTQGACNNKLTINGPTKAKNYRFWRTNTDTSATSAAEVFVFPPSSIMAPYGAASTGSKISTDYELELPSRY